jgi:class 3 adenylate cyclase
VYICTKVDGTLDVEISGDAVNIAARLASAAGAGEALISDAAFAAADLRLDRVTRRELELKGKSQLVGARIMRA